MGYTYTYRKSDGEDVWTVGYDKGGEWIPESDWDVLLLALRRVDFLNGEITVSAHVRTALDNIQKQAKEMMQGYRAEGARILNDEMVGSDYHRGAADACANILDLPEMKLFLKPSEEEVK